jgi:hypothetical protein
LVVAARRSGAVPSAKRPSTWTVEYYVTASGSSPVLEWVRRLPEPKRAAWLAFVDFALVPMGKDIAHSGYVKPLGQGLFELRVDHNPAELAQVFGVDPSTRPELTELTAEGILLRVFCTFYGDKIVLLRQASTREQTRRPSREPSEPLGNFWPTGRQSRPRRSGLRAGAD